MFRATVSSEEEELTWRKSGTTFGRTTISPQGWPSPLNVPSAGPATHGWSSSPSSAKRRSYSCTEWGPRPWNRSVAPSPPGVYLSLTAPEAPRRAHASRSSEAGISWILRTSALRSSRKFKPRSNTRSALGQSEDVFDRLHGRACRGPSAAHPVAQVQHPVAPDDHVGVLQQVLAVHRPEVPLTGPEHHRGDVHRHLVHQAEREGLPADVARRYRHGALPGELLRLRDGLRDIVDEVVRRLRVPPVRLGPVRHHDHVLPRRRPALPAVRHVEQVPPDHHRPDAVPRRTDAVVRRLRDPHPAQRRLVHLAGDERVVAVEVPVEQRADLVVLVGDVAVHRHHVVHHYSAHHFSLAGLFLQNYLRTLVFGYPKTVYRQNRHHGRRSSPLASLGSLVLGRRSAPSDASAALSGDSRGSERGIYARSCIRTSENSSSTH